MAPKMKRPAASAPAPPAAAAKKSKSTQHETPTKEMAPKKRASTNPLFIKGDAVAVALESAEGYPQIALQMLSGSIRHSLTVPKHKRHELQESVIKMIGEVLAGSEAAHVEASKAQRDKVTQAEGAKASRMAAVESAAVVVAARSAGVQEARSVHSVAAKEVRTATQEHSARVKEHKAGDAVLEKELKRKVALEAMVKDSLVLMKDGFAPASALLETGKDLGFSDQLLVSSQAALNLAAADRGSFDQVVIEQLMVACTESLKQISEELATVEDDRASRAANVDEAQKKEDDATGKLQLRKKDLEAAEAGLLEAMDAREAAEQAVQDSGLEMKQLGSEAGALESQLQACRNALAYFMELADGSFWQAAEAASSQQGEEAAIGTDEPDSTMAGTAKEVPAALQGVPTISEEVVASTGGSAQQSESRADGDPGVASGEATAGTAEGETAAPQVA